MTSNADFKRRVRERMDRTGERYMAARAHLLRSRGDGGSPPSPPLVGGRQADLAAVANALARAGIRGSNGGPIDELDVFGLGGGVGFMVAVFVYDGFGPTMTVTTRTVSMPDPFIDAALHRAGAVVEERTTGSAKVARTQLDEALDAGHQVLLSVDTAALPHHGGDSAAMAGGAPRVVGVLGREGDEYLVDDRSITAHRVDASTLADARAVVKKARHRMIVVRGPVDGHDPVTATGRALARTIEGYDEAPAKSFANNVGTNGFRTWATRLTSAGKRGWGATFAEPAHLHYGLRRLVECIDHDYSAGSANRPLYAEWLRRAGDALADPELADLGDSFESSAGHWRAIADLATTADPSVTEAVDLLERSQRLLDDGGDGAAAEARELRGQLATVQATATLGGGDDRATELFAAIAEHVIAIADAERAALDDLAATLGDRYATPIG